jgi:hypothetical protein
MGEDIGDAAQDLCICKVGRVRSGSVGTLKA